MSEPTNLLPPFPTDEVTLNLIDHSLDGAYEFHGDERVLVGADMTFSQLLDFMSGYDPTKAVFVREGGPEPGIEGAAVYEYPDPMYTPNDVIRALVAEVRRLRRPADE